MTRLLSGQRIERERHGHHRVREQRIAERVEATYELTEIGHEA